MTQDLTCAGLQTADETQIHRSTGLSTLNADLWEIGVKDGLIAMSTATLGPSICSVS